MTEKIVRIGGASGAWGDSPGALTQLLGAGVDYFMMDYLAEVSMSLLARARMKDANAGYPSDFIAYLKAVLPELARRGVKVATNAGGVNPAGCKQALEAVISELGLSMRVAMVEGDDVTPLIEQLRASDLRETVSGEPLPKRLLTANAYLGALPIRAAFDGGADIVITGRCADSALALGILMHEFGWATDDYDRLGAGSLVGHILECGPQATGGNYTDWEKVPDWHNIGYPIAECRACADAVQTTRPSGFLSNAYRGAWRGSDLWRAFASARLARGPAAPGCHALQSGGHRTICARAWIHRLELRARNHGNLQRAAKGDAARQALHVFPRQDRVGATARPDWR